MARGVGVFRPRDTVARPLLLALSRGLVGHVRFWAIRGLARPRSDSLTDVPVAREAVLGAIGDDDRRVRTEAVRALGTY